MPDLTACQVALPTGVVLDYVELGPRDRPVVIFLHGFTDSWRSWQRILPPIAEAYHTVALSQRGHRRPLC